VRTPGGTSGNFQSQARTISFYGCSNSGDTSHWVSIEEEKDEEEKDDEEEEEVYSVFSVFMIKWCL
jgi:hypothetical protein